MLGDLAGRRLRHRHEACAAIEQPQRQRLEQEGRDPPAPPAHLDLVVATVDVVDQHQSRGAQPERGQESHAVDHLEHHVGVGHQPAPLAPDRPREDCRAPADPVDRQVAVALQCRGARVGAADHRDAVARRQPAHYLLAQVRARAPALWMRPVAIRQHEDVHGSTLAPVGWLLGEFAPISTRALAKSLLAARPVRPRTGAARRLGAGRRPPGPRLQRHGLLPPDRRVARRRRRLPVARREPTARWPPVYPALLCLVYWIFGVHTVAGELLNALVGAAAAPLVYLCALRLFGRREAAVAGVLWRSCPARSSSPTSCSPRPSTRRCWSRSSRFASGCRRAAGGPPWRSA